jgi:AcrR family transcriptional regulator
MEVRPEAREPIDRVLAWWERHVMTSIHTISYGCWQGRLYLSIRCRIDMPVANVRTPRGAWVDAALDALAAGGPDAVRVEALAKALGVTKGGFYWHFTDRQALLEEMLDAWERMSIDEAIERVESEDGDARARLRRLFALATSSEARRILKTDLAVRDWSRRDRTVAKRLRRADNRRMAYMRSLFGAFCADDDDVEARCMVAMALFVGNHFVAADHGARSRADVLELALRRLLA